MAQLKEGDLAPDFTGKDQNGNPVSLKDFRGKKLILYFYPKDDTPGCTSEACNLRDNYSELINRGFEVIGISADSEKSHQKFIHKYNLPFTLLSDAEKSILKDYDAWGKKSMYGKLFKGILRKTFVIDENGTILRIIDKVKTGDHTSQILETLSN